MIWPFQRRQRVTYHLRSGATLSFTCRKFSLTVRNGNELTGVEVTGGSAAPFYIRLDAIDAIEVARVWL